jgi:purine-binding chemotaxis protein CheW
MSTETAVKSTQYLTFVLGGEVFAMAICTMREIIQHTPLTSIPMIPAFVRGVLNLRGAVVPVIDLQARFGRPATEVGGKSCIVIFEALRNGVLVETGLLVDAVSAIVEIPAQQIEAAPKFGGAEQQDFIRGMGKVDNRFVIILEPDRAFDLDEPLREPARLPESELLALEA